jgi:hypothetical protein
MPLEDMLGRSTPIAAEAGRTDELHAAGAVPDLAISTRTQRRADHPWWLMPAARYAIRPAPAMASSLPRSNATARRQHVPARGPGQTLAMK